MSLLHIIFGIIFSYLVIWTAYLFVFSVAGLFYRLPKKSKNQSTRKYAILIPAYKEDAVILDSVRKNLKVSFPKNRFQIFVIADSLQEETLSKLNQQDVKTVVVNFENSTKAKAMNEALKQVDPQHFSHTIVLDADNIMDANFLTEIDSYEDKVTRAAQAHRTSKGNHSAMSILDGINEEVGNHIFRKGHRVLRLSSALIGSAMIFETHLFKRLMAPIRDTAGEDKMLEFALLDEKIIVEYLNTALVYDEKLAKQAQFEGQRTRWVAARFYFLSHYAKTALGKLLHADIDYFNKWLQFLLPQKLLLIAYVFVFWFLALLLSVYPLLFTVLLFMLLTTFLISTPKSYFSLQTLQAIFSLPGLVFKMFKVLISAKKADPARFNVTEKNV